MIYPIIEEISGSIELVPEATHPVFLVEYAGRKLVYKLKHSPPIVKSRVKRLFKAIENPFPDWIERKESYLAIREKIDASVLDTEEDLLSRWLALDLPVARVFENQGIALVLQFLEGETLKDILAKPELNVKAFDAYLATMNAIRASANGNYHNLHPDPHPGNFIYSTDGLAYAIDPGLKLKPNLEFEDVDAKLNFQILTHIDQHAQNAEAYIETFLGELSHNIKDRMAAIAASPVRLAHYLKLRNKAKQALGKKPVNYSAVYHLGNAKRLEEMIRSN